MLVVSSDLPEVLGLCDRVLVMADGRITGELPGAEATAGSASSRSPPHARAGVS